MTLSDRIAALSEFSEKSLWEAFYELNVGDFRDGDIDYQRKWQEFGSLIGVGAWVDAALTLASPALQAHTMAEALKLVFDGGFTVGKFTEALAIAICVVALREKGL